MGFADPFFDIVFAPLINLHPGISIVIISLFISLIIIFATKLFTNQKEMKELKERLKSYQDEMKSKRDQPEEVLKVQKEAMKINMEYMKKTFKVTLITLIPILLVFSWLNGHFTYEPISPEEEFVVSVEVKEGVSGNISIDSGDLDVIGASVKEIENNLAVFTLKGREGDYLLTFEYYDNGSLDSSVDKDLIISTQRTYAPLKKTYKDDVFETITIGNSPLRIWGVGWIWVYLISAILFSSILRKVFKVY